MGKERPRPRWNRTEDGKRWINKTPRKVNDDGWMTVKGSDTDKTPVVDIRGLAAGVTRPDLVQELQGRFGHNIVNVLMLQDRALVEYEDQTGSSNLVTHAARNQVYIFDQPVTIQYSKFQKILTNPPARMTVIRFTRQQSDDITEAAVLSTMQRFGTVTTVVMKLKRGLAHVEYEDMTGSGKAVTYAEENQLYVSGHPVSISYGKDEIISVSPSRTVFVRFRSEQQLVDAVTKMEVVEAMDVFGTISNVNMMLHKGWALVKYEDTTGSAKAVNYAAENQVYVSGLPVSISYSSSNVVEALTSPRVFILFRGDKKVDEITEAVLVAALEEFGTIKHVVHMNAMKRHAIVEYEDLTGSANAVSYAGKNQVYISGHPVVINYSRDRQRISKTEAQTLPSPVGEIRDVVDGISELIGRIEGTNKPTRLNVSKNGQDTWDYTNPNRGGQDAGVQGNRNNSPYPNANPNKRPRQPTYPGDRPPRYGGPQGGYHHHNDNYESYAPAPHYEGRRMGPPMDAPPTHYEGRRRRMEPPMGGPPPHYEGRGMEPQMGGPPHYEGRRMEPQMGGPSPHYEGRRMEPPMGGPSPHYDGRRMEPPMGGPSPHYEGRHMGPPMGGPSPEYGHHDDWSGSPWP